MQNLQKYTTLEHMWGLFCFCAAQLLVNVSLNDLNFVQYKNYICLARILQPANMFLCFQTQKINPAKSTMFTVLQFSLP